MYRVTTNGVQVTVEPQFLPEHSDPKAGRYVWAYRIEIRNVGDRTVRLRNRHWCITDALGRTEEVRGPGVVGEEPTLAPGGAFQYTSGCPLKTPSGIMVGTYEMELENGERFLVDIPAFSLDLPDKPVTVN
jgi:ApaG protein